MKRKAERILPDGGFSSQVTYRPEVHPKVMWAKFYAVSPGAELATARLWP